MKTPAVMQCFKRKSCYALSAFCLLGFSAGSQAWTSKDGTWEVHGFVDQTTHYRFSGDEEGLSKNRSRAQLEFSKYFKLKPGGLFSEVSLHGTLRATYDSAFDLNSDFDDDAGGPVQLDNAGGPVALTGGFNPLFMTAVPPSPLAAFGVVPTTPTVPFGGGLGGGMGSPNNTVPPGFFDFGTAGVNNGNLGFDSTVNPNDGLRIFGSGETGGLPGFGGVQLAFPVRPCDVDPRGCVNDYLDNSSNDLRSPEFNDRQDWLREFYLDATIPLKNGHELNFRIGRQQVVWGRTDLFRVLDQVNPIDFSIQNIYEEFEDSRIPQAIWSTEYRAGPIGVFDDLNFQALWVFEEFTPHDIGQGGEPYAILGAGNLIRALSNCWHFGCTVSNFAANNSPAPPVFNDAFAPGGAMAPPPGFAFAPNSGLVAVDFAPGTLGVRQANLPKSLDQFGFRVEGVYKGIGFSANYLSYYQQLPSLRGGTAGPPAVNPFITEGVANPLAPPGLGEVGGTAVPRPFLIAFDIEFPKVDLVGGSFDFYVDSIKSAFRVEAAFTSGEEFVNTLDPRLFSDSDVVRWVVGWDRETFIRFLNPNRAFLLSAQVFGQHLLDHELIQTAAGPAGFVDWDDNYLFTFLIQGRYRNDRLQPRLLMAYDTEAEAGVIGPAVDWIVNDNLRVIFGGNFKFGGARDFPFDDIRSANLFPPFTDPGFGQVPATQQIGQTLFRSQGNGPLGIFRAGPIGSALDEDEFQLLVRYQF